MEREKEKTPNPNVPIVYPTPAAAGEETLLTTAVGNISPGEQRMVFVSDSKSIT